MDPAFSIPGRLSFSQLLLILAYIFLQSHLPSSGSKCQDIDRQLQDIAGRRDERWNPEMGDDRFSDMSQDWKATDRAWNTILSWMVRNNFCNVQITEDNLKNDLYRLLYRVEQVSAQWLHGLARRKPHREPEAGLDSALGLMLICYSLSIFPWSWSIDCRIRPPIWKLDQSGLDKMFRFLQTSPLFPTFDKKVVNGVMIALYYFELLFPVENPDEHEDPDEHKHASKHGEDKSTDQESPKDHLILNCEKKPIKYPRLDYKRSFDVQSNYQSHQDQMHGDPNLECNYENRRLPSVSQDQGPVNRHVKKAQYASKRDYECFKCEKRFLYTRDRNEHQDKKHADPQLKCESQNCKRSFGFASQASLDRHLKTHRENKPFSCPRSKCGASFTTKGNLRRHQRATMHFESNKDNTSSLPTDTERGFREVGLGKRICHRLQSQKDNREEIIEIQQSDSRLSIQSLCQSLDV